MIGHTKSPEEMLDQSRRVLDSKLILYLSKIILSPFLGNTLKNTGHFNVNKITAKNCAESIL